MFSNLLEFTAKIHFNLSYFKSSFQLLTGNRFAKIYFCVSKSKIVKMKLMWVINSKLSKEKYLKTVCEIVRNSITIQLVTDYSNNFKGEIKI